MYVPAYFRVEDPVLLEQFIRENSFATIVSQGTQYPLATHIPLELEVNKQGQKVLWGHVSRTNPQWKQLVEHPYVTVIYLSPIQGYISSSWYDHPNVPTWNYLSVQVTGKCCLLDEEEAWASVSRLVDKYEQDSTHPVSLETLPPEVQKAMKGLVAFEIVIDKMEGAFKLSQNRDEKNFKAIIEELEKKGDSMGVMLATAMKRTRAQQ